MYKKMILEDIRNATSSPVSAGGASHLNSPDGRKIDPYGQEAALASHTAQQGNNSGITMRETSGLPSSASSLSADLNLHLANKLKTRFAMGGSIEYTQTWKERITPLGRSYWEHTASDRRTKDSVSTGELSAWPKTPMAGDSEGGQMEIRIGTTGKYKLRDWATVSAWPTAAARKGTVRKRMDQIPRVAYQVFLHGIIPPPSSAGMGKLAGYRLNPYFSGWLMGFPKEWTKAGLRAFRKLKASRSQKKRKDE